MTNEQLYLIVGAPVLFNAVLIGLLMAYVNSKFEGMAGGLNEPFRAIDQRFDALDRRFDDMRDLWRAELHRVEEVIDARLKHLELR